MKKIDLILSVLLVPLDYVMIILAGIASYQLRYGSIVTQYRPVFFDVSFTTFLNLLWLTATIGILVLAWLGAYRVRLSLQPMAEFRRIFTGISTTLLVVIIAIFLRRELFSSRFIILAAWIFAIFFTYFGRVLLFQLKYLLQSQGRWSYLLILIGQGEIAERIASYYRQRPRLGYRIELICPDFSQETKIKVEQLIANNRAQELILCSADLPSGQMEEAVNFCNEHSILLRYVASIYQSQLLHFDIANINGLPVIQVKKTPLDGWGRIAKRIFDIFFSLLVLIILSPIFLLIAIIIKSDSQGPVIYRAQRIGQYGKVFVLYKFRSMVDHADQLKPAILAQNERVDGPLFKMQNDPRITRVGKILRRSSLDELPQFYNALVGNMSIVGPRPHEPNEVAKYQRPHKKLLMIKPGLTGMAQISGRSSLSFADEAYLDINYIENWSLWQDMKIILRTPVALLRYHNAV